jgi:hypothetical protein
MDPAVAVMASVLTAFRGAAVGGDRCCLQDGLDDASVAGSGAGQDPLGSRSDISAVEGRTDGTDHVGRAVSHHCCGAHGRVTIEVCESLQDSSQFLNIEHGL